MIFLCLKKNSILFRAITRAFLFNGQLAGWARVCQRLFLTTSWKLLRPVMATRGQALANSLLLASYAAGTHLVTSAGDAIALFINFRINKKKAYYISNKNNETKKLNFNRKSLSPLCVPEFVIKWVFLHICNRNSCYTKYFSFAIILQVKISVHSSSFRQNFNFLFNVFVWFGYFALDISHLHSSGFRTSLINQTRSLWFWQVFSCQILVYKCAITYLHVGQCFFLQWTADWNKRLYGIYILETKCFSCHPMHCLQINQKKNTVRIFYALWCNKVSRFYLSKLLAEIVDNKMCFHILLVNGIPIMS